MIWMESWAIWNRRESLSIRNVRITTTGDLGGLSIRRGTGSSFGSRRSEWSLGKVVGATVAVFEESRSLAPLGMTGSGCIESPHESREGDMCFVWCDGALIKLVGTLTGTYRRGSRHTDKSVCATYS